MPIKQYEPIDSKPILLSPEKRLWWGALWPGKGKPKQPRMAVLHYAMSATMRPSSPDETILYGYVSLNKFHDREPEAILNAIEKIDPLFFDSFPMKALPDDLNKYKRAVIGEACRVFYRYGLAAYGKPGLRRQDDTEELSPLAVI